MRRATTKYVGQKATPNKCRKPSNPAVRDPDPQLENKRKYSSDSTSQQDVPSEPGAKKIKTAPDSSSELALPNELLAKALSASKLYKTPDPETPSEGSTPRSQVQRTEAHTPGLRHLSEAVEGECVTSAADATSDNQVDFGILECIGNHTPPYRLRKLSKQSEWTELTVQRNGVPETLRECTTLADGDCVRFGDGYWYKYRAPKWSNLYEIQDTFYDNRQTNSSVSHVKRLSDEHPFVAKTVLKTEIDMARTEIEVFKTVGYHPNITRFIEGFLDPSELSHRKTSSPPLLSILILTRDIHSPLM
ncbi:hypothetical protein FRC00_006680 [Tulasnella sp. 408]|nr:hypothetical protein FRC00_006680 [Tulasnella sp. 408]